MVRQFNFRNCPVKAKFVYLCTNGCCRLRNILLVKLCTLWDDGATAGNSLENCFPEYLTVPFSRCVGCQKGQQFFVLSGHFTILERAKNRRGLSQVNKADGPFFVLKFLGRNSRTQRIIHRGTVIVENPLIRPESGSFPPNRFSWPCQHFQITLLIYHLYLCNEFIVNYPLVIEETHKHGLDLPSRHACFFRPMWILCFPLHTLSFLFGIVLKTPRFITGNDPMEHICIT